MVQHRLGTRVVMAPPSISQHVPREPPCASGLARAGTIQPEAMMLDRSAPRPRSYRPGPGLTLILAGFALVLTALMVRAFGTSSGAASGSGPQLRAPHARAGSHSERTVRGSAGSLPALGTALTGMVRSAGGAPLAGATVCALPGTESCCSESDCTTSDASGRFTLQPGLNPAESLVASAPGYLARGLALARGALSEVTLSLERGGVAVSGRVVDALGGAVPGALVTLPAPGVDAPPLALADGEGRFVLSTNPGPAEVVAGAEGYFSARRRLLAPTAGVIVTLGPESEIAGRVSDATGQPVAGLRVVANSLSEDDGVTSASHSDAEGAFHIRQLAGGGLYELTASSEAWRSQVRRVSVEVGQVSEPVLLQVQSATSLLGTVLHSGEPCPGAWVSAYGPVESSAHASVSGAVRLNGLLPGTYRVSVRCHDALPLFESITVGHEAMRREWAMSDGLAVHGRVLNARGQPAPHVVVAVSPAREPFDGTATTCVSSADGEFTCRGLNPGEYSCAIADDGDARAEVVPVTLPELATREIVLHTSAQGSIRVALAAAGARPDNLRVFARGDSGMALPGVEQQGHFVFEALPLGHYEVYVELPSSGSRSAAVLDHDGQLLTLELGMPSLGSIEGRVVDSSGTPVADAWVRVDPVAALARPPLVADEPVLSNDHGEFRFVNLARGAYDVSARTSSAGSERHDVMVDAPPIVLQLGSPDAPSTVASSELSRPRSRESQ
jgi:hypothetical protein